MVELLIFQMFRLENNQAFMTEHFLTVYRVELLRVVIFENSENYCWV